MHPLDGFVGQVAHASWFSVGGASYRYDTLNAGRAVGSTYRHEVVDALAKLVSRQMPLGKRIELYVYMAEESDWGPLTEFAVGVLILHRHPEPEAGRSRRRLLNLQMYTALLVELAR
jgi:hypothetical protein